MVNWLFIQYCDWIGRASAMFPFSPKSESSAIPPGLRLRSNSRLAAFSRASVARWNRWSLSTPRALSKDMTAGVGPPGRPALYSAANFEAAAINNS